MTDNVTHLPLLRNDQPTPKLVELVTAVSLAIDGAELFAYSLDSENLAEDPQRAAYLLGLAEAHIISMVAIVRGLRP